MTSYMFYYPDEKGNLKLEHVVDFDEDAGYAMVINYNDWHEDAFLVRLDDTGHEVSGMTWNVKRLAHTNIYRLTKEDRTVTIRIDPSGAAFRKVAVPMHGGDKHSLDFAYYSACELIDELMDGDTLENLIVKKGTHGVRNHLRRLTNDLAMKIACAYDKEDT